VAKTGSMLAALGGAAICLAACAPSLKITPQQACQIAVYRLADGRVLDVAPASGGKLRWRLDNGRTGLLAAKNNWSSTLGWTGKPDGVSLQLPPCGGTRIGFIDQGAPAVSGERIALQTQETSFKSGDVTLFGKLVTPVGSAPVPIVVDVHGSEKEPATVFDYDQRMIPAQGVGVFVYDKRGTGRSTGKYTQDFDALARDAAAAELEARRLAGARLSRIGFSGGSQGGWVAPLAATLTPVDFVVVGYGMAGSPGEENTDQTVLELKRKGYGAADLAGAAEVAEAANAVLGSRFRSGFDKLDAAHAKYGDKPWFKELGGQFTGQFMDYPSWMLRLAGPMFDVGTPVTYDAVAPLKRVKAPMLWVLADDDTLAPNATTRQRLAALIAEGSPITILAFPRTDHGIMEFATTPDGERHNTRYAEGYFRTTIDWAKTGVLSLPYGASVLIGQPIARPLQ
jgi:uncharacterized protein